MAGMIGPITLTIGQPYQLNLSLDSTRVVIDNDSPYDVWFAFRTDAPPVVTTSSGQWHGIMRRGHTGMVPVFGRAASTREAQLNAIGSFAGVMWLLAVNPGNLATNGTISSRANVFVTPLSPNDPDPVYSALATQVDLTSQPRVVSVPIGVQQANFGPWNQASGTTITVETLVLSAANLAGQFAVVYTYYASLVPKTTGLTIAQLRAQPEDSGGGALGSPFLLYEAVAACDTTSHALTPSVFAPAVPNTLVFGPTKGFPLPANTTKIVIEWVWTAGDKLDTTFAVMVDLDRMNDQPAADHGNFGGWQAILGGTPLF